MLTQCSHLPIPAPGNMYTNFGYPMLFCFQVRHLYVTDRHTDKTDEQDP